MTRLIAAMLLVLGACSSATAEFETLSPSVTEPSVVPEVQPAADDICAEHRWAGIPEPGLFEAEATTLDVEPAYLTQVVRSTCPDAFYEQLSKAEIDWCGDGFGFGQNFFMVVEAGLDLGIASFTVVEPGLLAKATSRSVELSDYEIELFTAELQTMTESARFERDWAEACRATF